VTLRWKFIEPIVPIFACVVQSENLFKEKIRFYFRPSAARKKLLTSPAQRA